MYYLNHVTRGCAPQGRPDRAEWLPRAGRLNRQPPVSGYDATPRPRTRARASRWPSPSLPSRRFGPGLFVSGPDSFMSGLSIASETQRKPRGGFTTPRGSTGRDSLVECTHARAASRRASLLGNARRTCRPSAPSSSTSRIGDGSDRTARVDYTR